MSTNTFLRILANKLRAPLYGLFVGEHALRFVALEKFPYYASQLHAYVYAHDDIIRTPADLRLLRLSPDVVFATNRLRYYYVGEFRIDRYAYQVRLSNRRLNRLYRNAAVVRARYYDIPETPRQRKALKQAFLRYTTQLEDIKKYACEERVEFADARHRYVFAFKPIECVARAHPIEPREALTALLDRYAYRILANVDSFIEIF